MCFLGVRLLRPSSSARISQGHKLETTDSAYALPTCESVAGVCCALPVLTSTWFSCSYAGLACRQPVCVSSQTCYRRMQLTDFTRSRRSQVMSWELLTRTKFYGQHADMAAVVDTLLGARQLCTEQPLTAEVQSGLKNTVYRDSIMAALSRDPRSRPTVAQLVHQWTSLFENAFNSR